MKVFLAIAIVISVDLAVRMVNSNLMPAPAVALQHALRELPLNLGEWTGVDGQFDERLFEHAGVSDMLTRTYENSVGEQVSVFVGTWLDYPTFLPHTPDDCYPRAGWEIASRDVIPIPGDEATQRR